MRHFLLTAPSATPNPACGLWSISGVCPSQPNFGRVLFVSEAFVGLLLLNSHPLRTLHTRTMATLAERAAAAQARLAPKAEQREAANAAAAPVKLNKSLQAAADYDGPVEKVELDGLAVLKILQHASGAISGPAGSIAAAPRGPALNAAGFVYGMQLGPQLSISNAFALPPNHLLPNNITSFSNVSISSSANADERTKAAKVAAEREKEVDAAYRNAKNFAGTFAPRAKELNLDSDIVGGYFVARDGMDLLREGVLVDILIRYQFGIGSGAGGASASGASGMASSADKRPAGANAKFKDASRLKKRGIAIVYGELVARFPPCLTSLRVR